MTLEIMQWPTALNVLTWGSSEAHPEAQFEYQWLIWEEALIGKWRSKTGKGWEPLNKQLTLWHLELSLSGGLLGVWNAPKGQEAGVFILPLPTLVPRSHPRLMELVLLGWFRTPSFTPSSRGFLLAREAILVLTLEPHATSWLSSLADDKTPDFSRITSSSFCLYPWAVLAWL